MDGQTRGMNDPTQYGGQDFAMQTIDRDNDDTSSTKNMAGDTLPRENNQDAVAGSSSDLESRKLSTHEDTDEKVVWWDGPHDPENPYNWPNWRKFLNCGLISIMTLVSALGSCE